MTDPDSELMERFRDGEEEAFRILALRFQRPLVNFFYRLTWDHFTAEDYAQEVFARVVRARDGYRPEAKFRTWLFRIARNYWIDRYRERKAAPFPLSLDQPMADADGSGSALGDSIAGPSPRPEDEARRREIRDAVKAAVAGLPEDQRLVFVLSENQGLKYAEIAEILEIPVGTVKSRMHAAVRRLREMLKDVYDAA